MFCGADDCRGIGRVGHHAPTVDTRVRQATTIPTVDIVNATPSNETGPTVVIQITAAGPRIDGLTTVVQ
jgi:hypothetical protein